eukprot:m.251703 g.251703  ORF g.251703 m.251703 type:complete len:364 (+) comp19112_c0_seq9:2410-3501(+)
MAAERVINFSAGPAVLPDQVLETAQKEMFDWHGAGMGVMEMSHRGKEFGAIINHARDQLRSLLSVPDNYKILFLQGGGTAQFASVPLNLMKGENATADYIVTGGWSQKAAKEAAKYGSVRVVNEEVDSFTGIPSPSTWKLNPEASYVYYCANETVHGVEFSFVPDTGDVPLVADMSSNFLSRGVDVSKFGLIYASAQKNIGCAGVVVVIVREDLLGNPHPTCPVALDYTVTNKHNSMYNTPPTWSIYISGLVFDWIEAQGGLAEMEKRADKRSSSVYDTIDASGGFYKAAVAKDARSHMNVRFVLGSAELDAKFLAEAAERKMVNLKGHRSLGGIRASMYNACKLEHAATLVTFMKEFQEANQ